MEQRHEESSPEEAFKKIFPYHGQRRARDHIWRGWSEAYFDCLDLTINQPPGMELTPEVEEMVQRVQAKVTSGINTMPRRRDKYFWKRYKKLLSTSRNMAKRMFRKAKPQETYYQFIVQLRELDFENLRARYLDGYFDDPEPSSSSWCPLSPYFRIILAEVSRERDAFEQWVKDVYRGTAVNTRPPSRKWNKQLLKVSRFAAPSRTSDSPWPFHRIMQVIEDSHRRQCEPFFRGSFLTQKSLWLLTATQQAIVLTQDLMVMERVPPILASGGDARLIAGIVEQGCRRLLLRIIRTSHGMLLGCYFRRDGNPWRLFGRWVTVVKTDAAMVWRAVPRSRVRGNRVYPLQRIQTEEDGECVIHSFMLPHWNVQEPRDFEMAVWDDTMSSYQEHRNRYLRESTFMGPFAEESDSSGEEDDEADGSVFVPSIWCDEWERKITLAGGVRAYAEKGGEDGSEAGSVGDGESESGLVDDCTANEQDQRRSGDPRDEPESIGGISTTPDPDPDADTDTDSGPSLLTLFVGVIGGIFARFRITPPPPEADEEAGG